ncbi:hypothetical protein [Corynebacterium hadale]
MVDTYGGLGPHGGGVFSGASSSSIGALLTRRSNATDSAQHATCADVCGRVFFQLCRAGHSSRFAGH